jgi:hypothetical protein
VTARALFVAVAAFGLLALAGCVGNEPRLSHREYEREMQAVARDLAAQAEGMQGLAGAPSGDVFGRLLRDVAGLMQEAADRVGDINPPEEIDEPHGKLAHALGDVADILDRSADRAEDGDFFGAMAVLDDAPDDLERDVRRTIAEIRTAGYYIGDSDDWG